MMATSKKEKFLAYNTLAILLMSMKNHILQVETKNESTIIGTMRDCDGYGNLVLHKAKLITAFGKQVQCVEVHVKASAIRYVHLPDSMDPIKSMKTQLNYYSRQLMPPKYQKN